MRHNSREILEAGGYVVSICLAITMVIGWAINFIEVVQMVNLHWNTALTTRLFLKVAGVFIPPLGAILGLFF